MPFACGTVRVLWIFETGRVLSIWMLTSRSELLYQQVMDTIHAITPLRGLSIQCNMADLSGRPLEQLATMFPLSFSLQQCSGSKVDLLACAPVSTRSLFNFLKRLACWMKTGYPRWRNYATLLCMRLLAGGPMSPLGIITGPCFRFFPKWRQYVRWSV